VPFYSLSDHHGSDQIELNKTGEIVRFESYSPFGACGNNSPISFVGSAGKRRKRQHVQDPAVNSKQSRFWFYDVDERNPPPILKNYKASRGDLIYGLKKPLLLYVNMIYPGYLYNSKHPPASINEYSDRIITAITQANPEIAIISAAATSIGANTRGNSDLKNSAIEAQNKQGVSIIFPEKYEEIISQIDSYKSRKLLWKEYFFIAKRNDKFNIEKIYRETSEKYRSSQYHKWLPSKFLITGLLFKRGSKLGIEMVARGNNKLHYALDEIDMSSVVTKLGQEGSSVSASELRYMYRNWARLEDKVHFYRYSQEVQAPWVENSTLWSGIKSSRPHIVNSQLTLSI
jgi:insecticidal toxin complex protein TccC